MEFGNQTEDVTFNEGLYPVDHVAEARLRQYQLTNPVEREYYRHGPYSGPMNQTAIMDTDLHEGVEAWDYQNPYVWLASTVLTIPDLQPRYGISSDTGPSVIANVLGTQNWLEK